MSEPPLPRFDRLWHGGDYSPEQWTPADWEKDITLLKQSGGNLLTVGVFAWVRMEPEEGQYDFSWLDAFLDLAEREGLFISLATPSASPPLWLGHRYPETLRVAEDGERFSPGMRVNTCYTSPVLRARVGAINREISRRYGHRKHVVWWHISNEYCFPCFCDLCQAAFRVWLRQRYDSLGHLNRKWNTTFWGHTYTDWQQIIAPGGKREISCEALWINWKRFSTAQAVDFMREEIAAVRSTGSRLPVTTNFMSAHEPLDYWQFAPELDFVSLDSYPLYHDRSDNRVTASQTSFHFDMMRSLKGGQPWVLMESSPSAANWMPVMKLKRPGVHRQECLQAIAHGADAILYFQVKKSRGGREKLHGAVIDHTAGNDSRVYREVAEVGAMLEPLRPVLGSSTRAEVAVIYDWENRWAIDACCGPRREGKDYLKTCQAHYQAFWSQGVAVDVVRADVDFSAYRLVIAPMLYLVKPGVAEALEKFLAAGGSLVVTYWSGLVDEDDLIFEGGQPGPLRKLLGVRVEEIDVLYDDESNSLVCDGGFLPDGAHYRTETFCEIIHAESASVLARHGGQFYAGTPALTRNPYGRGQAFYLAARTGDDFLADFYTALVTELELARPLSEPLPVGVTARWRGSRFFLINCDRQAHEVSGIPENLIDCFDHKPVPTSLTLPAYGTRVLQHADQ